MNRPFLTGVASGYLAIALQSVVGLLLVPFLFSRHGVGLAGFGVIATVQALAAIPGVGFDGHRQDASRRIAGWVAVGDRVSFAGLLRFTLLVTLLVALAGGLLAGPAAAWLDPASGSAVTALRLAIACFVLEQFCFLMDSRLHAARRSWIVNALGACDAVARAALVVALFMMLGPSVELFFVAALAGLAFKSLSLWVVCRRCFGPLPHAPAGALHHEAAQLRRSLPLALNGVGPFLVFRLGIILGSRFLGPHAAGALAIIAVTLRTYLNQLIFSAMRPMLVSWLAQMNITDAASPARAKFFAAVTVYQAAVYALAVVAICATPVWLPLWLGESMRPFVPHAMAALALYFAEIAYGVPYYGLVAHDRAQRLALMTGVAAAGAAVALLIVAVARLPLAAYIAVIMAYLAAYVLLVRHSFRRLLGFRSRALDLEAALAVAAVFAGSAITLYSPGLTSASAIAAAAALLFALRWWHVLSRVPRPARP